MSGDLSLDTSLLSSVLSCKLYLLWSHWIPHFFFSTLGDIRHHLSSFLPVSWFGISLKAVRWSNIGAHLVYLSHLKNHCLLLPSVQCFKSYWFGLPWWHNGWESACQCRGHGFEPWSGNIPHATEQLGPWATTTEPARLEPVLCNKRGRDSERPAHHDEEWPPLAATREGPSTETKTQHSHK